MLVSSEETLTLRNINCLNCILIVSYFFFYYITLPFHLLLNTLYRYCYLFTMFSLIYLITFYLETSFIVSIQYMKSNIYSMHFYILDYCTFLFFTIHVIVYNVDSVILFVCFVQILMPNTC